MIKKIVYLQILIIAIQFSSCSRKGIMTNSTKMTITYNDTIYNLDSMLDSKQVMDSRFFGNKELQTTNYELDENFGITISTKPSNWNANEAIDKWQNNVIETWQNNAIGVKRLTENCEIPCEDLVFTFALEGLYYYNRIYIFNGKIIELMAIYDDPNEYQEFKKVYESFGK